MVTQQSQCAHPGLPDSGAPFLDDCPGLPQMTSPAHNLTSLHCLKEHSLPVSWLTSTRVVQEADRRVKVSAAFI